MAKFSYEFERAVVELETRLEELKKLPSAARADIAQEIKYLETQIDKLRRKVYSDLTAWQKVQIARRPDRPRSLDYIGMVFNDFTELRGDRLYKDDPAVVGGLAYLDHQKVAIIGQQKGRNVKENVKRNFGMPHPEGYRKALRIMKLAEKFGLPVISLIDTPGAYPGIGAEERGQAWAIAASIMEMSRLKTPIIAVNIGEGGSGGALAIGVVDKLYMLENAYYSVITPEGCASILWRDEAKAEEAAETLKLTAGKLLELGFVDGVIKEPLGGAHRDPDSVIYRLRKLLLTSATQLRKESIDDLVSKRYQKLRSIGEYLEGTETPSRAKVKKVKGIETEKKTGLLSSGEHKPKHSSQKTQLQ